MFILDFSVILQCHTLTAPYFMFTVHMHKQSVTHKGCHLTSTLLVKQKNRRYNYITKQRILVILCTDRNFEQKSVSRALSFRRDLIPFHSCRRSAFDLKLEVVKRNVLLNRLQNIRIFAYSSTREQSNERFGTKLKTESETGERVGFFSLARALRP